MEAVIGAVYVDGGMADGPRPGAPAARRPHRRGAAGGPGGQDYKTRLQELSARRFDEAPDVRGPRRGPDHASRFHVTVAVGGVERGDGEGRSKKQAEQAAAARRLRRPSWRRAGERTMPELPEVETLRRGLEREIVGRRIKTVDVHGGEGRPPQRVAARRSRAGSRAPRSPASTAGASTCCSRSTPATLLVITSAHERPAAARRAQGRDRQAHPRRRVTFTQGGQLRFVDPRTFGEVFVVTPDPLTDEVPELANLGFDPVGHAHVVDRRSPRHWWPGAPRSSRRCCSTRPSSSGIGNIYADEILYDAGLRYDRECRRCRPRRSGGSTARSSRSSTRRSSTAARPRRRAPYVDLNGKPGEYQEHHRGVRPRRPAVPPLPRHGQPPAQRRPGHLLLPELPGVTAGARGERPGGAPARATAHLAS